jgi:protein-S-isoprenylcysteine O-methyltransferase Ste14
MRQVVPVVGGMLLIGALLLWLGGSWVWWNAWCFVAVMLLLGLASAHAVDRSPGLGEERRTAAKHAPRWDRTVVRCINLALPLILFLAAIDHRQRWLPAIPVVGSAAAFVCLLPAAALTYRAMIANPFFSSHVRIQSERGHSVVADGPYRHVRHPGYAGAAVSNSLIPIALGSWLAVLPGVLAAALLVWRTAREDRFLTRELPGYAEYADRVRYRLVPGVW